MKYWQFLRPWLRTKYQRHCSKTNVLLYRTLWLEYYRLLLWLNLRRKCQILWSPSTFSWIRKGLRGGLLSSLVSWKLWIALIGSKWRLLWPGRIAGWSKSLRCLCLRICTGCKTRKGRLRRRWETSWLLSYRLINLLHVPTFLLFHIIRFLSLLVWPLRRSQYRRMMCCWKVVGWKLGWRE